MKTHVDILGMNQQDLLDLRVHDIGDRRLSFEEFAHIARTLGALWTYDKEAAARGKVGMHALLKSGQHSNVFFVSKILLEPDNILKIMANQIALRIRWVLRAFAYVKPDSIVGVPDGATKLGEEVGRILGIPTIRMAKIDGQIEPTTPIKAGERILFVEDFCTRMTGFIEAASAVLSAQPDARIIPIDSVILNRGGLESVHVKDVGMVIIVPVVKWKAWDCDPDEGCELCEMGSVAIKPKASYENWRLLTTSQL